MRPLSANNNVWAASGFRRRLAGDAIEDDEFTIQVFDSVGSAVDPDKPFDGIRNQNPNFENGLRELLLPGLDL